MIMSLAGPPVEVLAGRVSVAARVDVTRGNDVLAVDVPCKNVQLDYNSEQTVPFRLAFDVPASYVPEVPLDALNNYGHRVHLSQVIRTVQGREYTVNLGWYLITEWTEDGGAVHVTATDLLKLLEDDPMAWPSSPARNADLKGEAQRLAGHLPVTFMNRDQIDMSTERSWEWGFSRTEAIRDLALARGLTYEVTTDGYLTFRPLKDGRGRGRTYKCTDLLLDAPRHSVERKPNRVIATGKGNVFDHWKTETVFDSNEGGTSGFSSRSVYISSSWVWRNDIGRLRYTWHKNDFASQYGFAVSNRVKIPKKGRTKITLGVTASRRMEARAGVLRNGELAGAHDVVIGATRTNVTINVPDGSSAEGFRVWVAELVQDGQWVEVDSIRVENTVKGKTTVLLNQTFYSRNRGNWAAVSGGVKWENTQVWNEKGIIRATTPYLSKNTSYVRPVFTFRKQLGTKGDKVVSFQMRSNKNNRLTVQFLRGDGSVYSSNWMNSTEWMTFTETVPALTGFSGFNITPTDQFYNGDYIEIKNLRIEHRVAEYREQSFVGRASMTAEPYGKHYGRVTRRIELESVTSRAGAVAAANRELSDAHIANDLRSVEIIPDPTIRGGDILGFIPEEGPPFTGRVTAFSLPVDDVNARMRLDLEVLQW